MVAIACGRQSVGQEVTRRWGSSEHGAGAGWDHARGSQAIVTKVAKPSWALARCQTSRIAHT